MTVLIRATRIAAQTSTGTQSFTFPGMGTPKAAIFAMAQADTNGVAADHGSLGVGMTDGGRQKSCAIFSKHGVSTTKSRRDALDGTLLHLIDENGSPVARAEFSAWVADGIEINWVTAPPSGYLVTCSMFGGADLAAKVDEITTADGDGGSVVVNTGFEPDAVVFVGCHDPFGGGPASGALFSVGAATRAGTANIAAIWGDTNGNSTTTAGVSPFCMIDSGRVARIISDVALGGSAEVTGYTTSTFTITTRHNASFGGGTHLAYLAMSLGQFGRVKAEVVDTPTLTGATTIGSNVIPPVFGLFAGTLLQAADAIGDDADAASFCVGMVAGRIDGVHAVTVEDGTMASSNTQSLTNAEVVALPLEDGSTGITANWLSWPLGGPSLDWVATLGAARKGILLTLAESLAGSSAGLAVASGSLVGAIGASGGSTGSSSAAGLIAATGALLGDSAGAASATGTLRGVGALQGTAAGTSTTQIIAGPGGISFGTSTASGVLTGAGALAGSSAGTSSATALLVLAGAHETLANYLRTKFRDDIADALAIDTAYDNAPFVPPAEAWIRLMVEDAAGELVETGNDHRYRRSGLLRARLHVPVEDGEADLLELADAVADAFRHTTVGIARMGAPGIGRIGRIEDNWVLDVTVPWYILQTTPRPVGVAGQFDGFQGAHDVIRSRFQDLVATPLSLTTHYGDAPMDTIPDGPWALLTVIPGTTDYADIARTPRYRTAGVVIASIFTPVEEGDRASRSIADSIGAAFRSVTDKGVVFREIAVAPVGRSRRFWQVNVKIPFYADEIR